MDKDRRVWAQKLLNTKWYAKKNDLIGGWSVCNTDLPPSKHTPDNGAFEIATFLDEHTARHIVSLHNEQLAARHDLPCWVFPIDAIPSVMYHDGEHRYFSTYCQHGLVADDDALHKMCAATEIHGVHVSVERKPAQCKICAAPCQCRCHHQEE